MSEISVARAAVDRRGKRIRWPCHVVLTVAKDGVFMHAELAPDFAERFSGGDQRGLD